MGLYINNREHPEVFKNKQNIKEPNQTYSRKDFFTELLNEYKIQSERQQETEDNHWKQLDNHLHDLRERNLFQQEFESQVIESLNALNSKISKQEEFQGRFLQRLDTQEALIDKLSLQLNHIRSILFERTNYLATKIEDGYKLTSSYVYKLMTGSDQPLTFFLLNNKKAEIQNQPDQS